MKHIQTHFKRILYVLLAIMVILVAVLSISVVLAAPSEFDWSSIGVSDGIGSADDLSNGNIRGAIIQFGSYPQTKVVETTTISILNSCAGDWHSYSYYSGNGTSFANGSMTAKDYMMFCDVQYEGSKYRGVRFSQYRPSNTGDLPSEIGSCQSDNGFTTGTTYWFKYEPLKWKVLAPSEGLIICVNIIDSQPYNNYILYCGTNDSYGYPAYWGDNTQRYYANNYANSSLRNWLNEVFYATAFTTQQQNQITVNQSQSNKGGYYTTTPEMYSDYSSDSTDDKIFLLSYDEVINPSYGFSSFYNIYDEARQAKGTDYAKCQGLYVYDYGNYIGNSWWRLRSSGISDMTCAVDRTGEVIFGAVVNSSCGGIRPACKLSTLQAEPPSTEPSSEPSIQHVTQPTDVPSSNDEKPTDDTPRPSIIRRLIQWILDFFKKLFR